MLPATASIFVHFLIQMCHLNYRKKKSLVGHIWYVCQNVYGLVSPVRLRKYDSNFNPHLWTIQLEFMGSMLVYLLVLRLCRFRKSFRIAILIGIMIQGVAELGPNKNNDYFVALFTARVLFAEFEIVYTSQKSYLSKGWTSTFRNITFATFATFAAGVYIGSHPRGMPDSPGYSTLYSILPFNSSMWGCERLYLILGGFLIIGSANFSPILQRPFTTTFAQYLGDISFSLYVLQNGILRNICKPLMTTTVAMFEFLGPEHTALSYACEMVLGLVFLVPFTFWVSELFTRFVDTKSVKLAKDIDLWAIVKPEVYNEGIVGVP